MIAIGMILMLVLVLVAVDLAAWRWGYDSRDVGTRPNENASTKWDRHT